jgi:hypothetical protein
MNHTLDIPDFLIDVVTPGAPHAYTEDDRRELYDLAVHLLATRQGPGRDLRSGPAVCPAIVNPLVHT